MVQSITKNQLAVLSVAEWITSKISVKCYRLKPTFPNQEKTIRLGKKENNVTSPDGRKETSRKHTVPGRKLPAATTRPGLALRLAAVLGTAGLGAATRPAAGSAAAAGTAITGA